MQLCEIQEYCGIYSTENMANLQHKFLIDWLINELLIE
jgi:hypothetical protein